MFSFLGTTCLGLVFTGRTAQAQVIENQPSTLVDSTSFLGHVILGGDSQGQNLFHSFSQMDTSSGQFINFIADPTVTKNVIGRITDSPTVLNGPITVTSDGTTLAPGVNLFLLSPQGISFGSKAITNIDGAFVATTASGMTFADGTALSAETAAPATLTISTPVGLQFNHSPAPIQVQGINHNLPSFGLNSLYRGQNILLIGGDVDLTGGSVTLLSGRLQIAGLAEAGTVALTSNSGYLSAVLPTGVLRANIALRDQAQILSSGPQESINLTAHNLTVEGGAQAVAVTVEGFPLPYRVGDINIDMTGDIALPNGSIFNSINLGAVGDAGDINITARSLSLSDGAAIGAIGLGSGNLGQLNIHAHERIVLDGRTSELGNPTGLYSLVGSLTSRQGSGQAGNVNITTGSLSVLNGAVISASALGQGDAGNIVIVADQVLVSKSNDLQGLSPASGNSTTPNFPGLVSNIASSVESTATGNGGSVDITASSVVLDHGGAIVGRTQGQGNAGSISLTVERLSASNGGQVVTASDTAGRAGDIRIIASDRILLSGTDVTYGDRVAASALNRLGGASSGIYASTSLASSGAGGNIALRAGQLSLNDTAQISVSSQGTGSAGSLAIAAEQVRLNHQSIIQAESREGDQGNVAIASSVLLLRDRSQITTNATGRATGGNISLNTPLIVGLGDSDIVARAVQGAGGKISINTAGLFGIASRPILTDESDINASSDSGIDGTVAIISPNLDPQNSLVELPANLADSTDELTAGCGAGQSQFVATGRGGLPPSPVNALNESRPWQDLRPIASQSAQLSAQRSAQTSNQASNQASNQTAAPQPNTASTPETAPPLQEAVAWNLNNAHEVVLLAAASSHSPSPQQQATCASR